MQFQQLNREDPEKVYAAVRNVSGATVSAGAAAYFITASPDGISVSNAGTTRKWGFAGILKDALSDSSYGRAQVYGYCSAYMLLSSSTVSAAAGAQLTAVNSQNYLRVTAASDLFTFVAVSSATLDWTGGNPFNYVTMLSAVASAAALSNTPALKPVFVRAM